MAGTTFASPCHLNALRHLYAAHGVVVRIAIAAALAFGLVVAMECRSRFRHTPRLAPNTRQACARVRCAARRHLRQIRRCPCGGHPQPLNIDVTWTTCDNSTAAIRPACRRASWTRRAGGPVRAARRGRRQVASCAGVPPSTDAGRGDAATVYVDQTNWLAPRGRRAIRPLRFAVAHKSGTCSGHQRPRREGLMRALVATRALSRATDGYFRHGGRTDAVVTGERNGLRSSERDATGCAGARDGDSDASTRMRWHPTPSPLRGMAAEPRR